MSENELLSLAYKLYPKNIWDDDPAYENTKQFEFLVKTISENKSEGSWTKLINKLRGS